MHAERHNYLVQVCETPIRVPSIFALVAMPVTMTGGMFAPGPSRDKWISRAMEEAAKEKHQQKKFNELQKSKLDKAQKERDERKAKRAKDEKAYRDRQKKDREAQRTEREQRLVERSRGVDGIRTHHETWLKDQADMEQAEYLRTVLHAPEENFAITPHTWADLDFDDTLQSAYARHRQPYAPTRAHVTGLRSSTHCAG